MAAGKVWGGGGIHTEDVLIHGGPRLWSEELVCLGEEGGDTCAGKKGTELESPVFLLSFSSTVWSGAAHPFSVEGYLCHPWREAPVLEMKLRGQFRDTLLSPEILIASL